MLKKIIFPMTAAGMTLFGAVAQTTAPAATPVGPFDYGAPALNRHSAIAIRNVSRQLKLRGVITLAGGGRTAMIDIGDDGKSLIVLKNDVIRVPLRDEQKDASVKINWLELRITDIGETDMTLQCVDDQRQSFVLR